MVVQPTSSEKELIQQVGGLVDVGPQLGCITLRCRDVCVTLSQRRLDRCLLKHSFSVEVGCMRPHVSGVEILVLHVIS